MYEIRLLKKGEYTLLKSFIKQYVSQSHIFLISKEIFEFQHGNGESGYYDVAIAFETQRKEIHAMMGFIRSSRYDGREFDNPLAIYGGTWDKIKDDNTGASKMIGLRVLSFVKNYFPNAKYMDLGLSKDSQVIFPRMGFDFGEMAHYYIANSMMESFSIAKNIILKNVHVDDKADVYVINSIKGIRLESNVFPYKNEEYIRNRYERHPIYKYTFLKVEKNGNVIQVIVLRKERVGDSSCFRIVDIVGDLQQSYCIFNGIQRFLLEENAEFVDCYNYGLNKNFFTKMGFELVAGNAIVPDYYHPFERKENKLHYVASRGLETAMFKGDGDQDRPRMKEEIRDAG